MIVSVRGIDPKFLAVYVTLKNKKFRYVRELFSRTSNRVTFAEDSDEQEAMQNFNSFKSSGQSIFSKILLLFRFV